MDSSGSTRLIAAAAAAVAFLAGCAADTAQKRAAAPAAPAAQPAAAPAEGTIKGKIVWVDLKNSALLVVCEDDAGCKSVEGKKGETYTLMIPAALKATAATWKEGGLVQIRFEDRPDGRALKSVSAP